MQVDLSFTEENYLKAIYHLSSKEDQAVSTNDLSEFMETTPASVSDMIKRLSRKQVLSHEKYKGVTLTKEGTQTALNIVRKHRLWEVFLVDKLNFNWDEVHEIAEQLEHIKSPLLVERLDEFLGNPVLDPHGDPIPDRNGNFNVGPTIALVEFESGGEGVVIAVKTEDPRLLQHLDKLGIRLGSRICVIDKNDFDQSMQVQLDGDKKLFLSEQVSSQLMISKTV